jgi:ankyrin repeat protein
VQMSRGNKQGNNAFTFDNFSFGNTVGYYDYKWMMQNPNVSLKEIEQVVSYNPNSRSNILSSIRDAIYCGDVEKAEYFIAENLKRDEYTFNKFHRLALIAKNVKELEDIAKRNVTKQAVGVGNFNPIMCACINPNIQVLQHMLDMKPDFNLQDVDGSKPVHYAACSSSTANIELLIKNGVDTRDINRNKTTPLMFACRAGRENVVEVLLGPNKSNVDAKDLTGNCAIHYAAQYGHT